MVDWSLTQTLTNLVAHVRIESIDFWCWHFHFISLWRFEDATQSTIMFEAFNFMLDVIKSVVGVKSQLQKTWCRIWHLQYLTCIFIIFFERRVVEHKIGRSNNGDHILSLDDGLWQLFLNFELCLPSLMRMSSLHRSTTSLCSAFAYKIDLEVEVDRLISHESKSELFN